MFCTEGIFYFIFAVFTCQKSSVYFQYFYICIALPAVRQYFLSSFFLHTFKSIVETYFFMKPIRNFIMAALFFLKNQVLRGAVHINLNIAEPSFFRWSRSRAFSDGAGAEHLCRCRLLLFDSTVAVAVTHKIDNLRYKHSIILHCPVLK